MKGGAMLRSNAMTIGQLSLNVIQNRKSWLCRRPGDRQVWTLDTFGAWPAGTRLYRNIDCAEWTIRDAARPASSRLASDRGPVCRHLLAALRPAAPFLAPHGNLGQNARR